MVANPNAFKDAESTNDSTRNAQVFTDLNLNMVVVLSNWLFSIPVLVVIFPVVKTLIGTPPIIHNKISMS